MKKTMITKIVVSLSMIGAVSLVDAQWAVTNVDDVAYFGPTGIFTQAMGQMSSAVKGAVDSVRATQGVQIQQTNNNQADTDQRNRIARMQQKIAEDDFSQMPTIQQCIDLTRTSVSAGGTAASVTSSSGGPGGAGGSAVDPKTAHTYLTTSANVVAQVLSSKQGLNTCNKALDGSLAQCADGDGVFANADIRPIGLKGNVSGKQSGYDISNWTMDQKGYAVAIKNAENATLFNAPKYIDPAKLVKNPGYSSMYQGIMQHLWAAQDSLIDIAKLRQAPAGSLGPAQAKMWASASADYPVLFGPGITPPASGPSSYELYNYQVFSDFLGLSATKNSNANSLDLQRMTNERIALSNMIAWQQYRQTENTNILLAHLLAVTTTPVNKAAVDAEQAKTVTMKQ